MSRGCSANELMFIKCFEDEKFHARAEGLCCYLGERLRKEDGAEGRGKILLRNSPEPLGLCRQAGFARLWYRRLSRQKPQLPLCSEQGKSELAALL